MAGSNQPWQWPPPDLLKVASHDVPDGKLDAWLGFASRERQRLFGKRFDEFTLTWQAWTSMCNGALAEVEKSVAVAATAEGGSCRQLEAADDRLFWEAKADACRPFIVQFLASEKLFLVDPLTVWERIKYYAKGLTGGLLSEDTYKVQHLDLQGKHKSNAT